MRKIRFGIYGAGTAASFHAEALKSIDQAELCGVSDRFFDFAVKLGEKYGIKAYSDFEEMLSDKSIDAICICTPSGYHAKDALTALDYGKHIVIEKPMAMNTYDCEKIKEKAENKGCTVTVIAQLRFSEDVRKVKSLIDENAFGKITSCSLYMKYWRDKEYYKSSPWRGTKEFDGGVLMNQGIHGIDLLCYFMGNAQVMYSSTGTIYHEIDCPDTAVAVVKFEKDILGVIESSVCSYPGFERKIEICGSEGCVVMYENTIEKLIIKGKAEYLNESSGLVDTSGNPKNLDISLHAAQLRNFIMNLMGNEILMCTMDDGINAVRLIENI